MENHYLFTLCAAMVISLCASAQPQEWQPSGISDTVTVSFIGDVMQHGGQISAALAKGGGKFHDYDNAFRYMEGRFGKADFMVANMEFTLGTKPYSGYPNFSAPPEIAQRAKEAGIDLFMLANNHIADKGAEGFRNTFECYKKTGVPTIGVYRSIEEEKCGDPMFVTLKGIIFAFFNFTYDTNGMPVTPPYHVNIQDSTYIKEVIAKAKTGGADIIIALPHWGEEYHLEPSASQLAYADLMFREGVDAIIGSHPHVPQKGYIYTEKHPGPEGRGENNPEVKRLVFYSLGNYISNQSDPAYTQTGTFVQLRFIRNRLSGRITMAMPEWEYTWCFRKGELESDYTVVPIEEFMKCAVYLGGGGSEARKTAFGKMTDTYGFIKKKRLIEIINE